MANETPHSILGFSVQFDGLIQRKSIHLNPADWDALIATLADRVKFAHAHSDIPVEEHTTLAATSVGPLSGPDAGTGPLLPVSVPASEKLPFTGHDDRPNAMSPVLEDQQNDAAGQRVSDANTQPYPTADVPAVPTSADPEDQSVEHEEEHKDGE